jgi:hypothetical protein
VVVVASKVGIWPKHEKPAAGEDGKNHGGLSKRRAPGGLSKRRAPPPNHPPILNEGAS